MNMSPEFYEAYNEDIEAFMADVDAGEIELPEVDEDGNVDEDEVVANWREGQEVFEAIENVEREDAHLEMMYEGRFEMEDYEPNPYFGDYSEM